MKWKAKYRDILRWILRIEKTKSVIKIATKSGEEGKMYNLIYCRNAPRENLKRDREHL